VLDCDDSLRELIEEVGPLVCEIDFPIGSERLFEPTGSLPPQCVDKRRFPRHHLRIPSGLQYRQTIPSLRRADVWHKVFVKDVSRCGLSFIHSEQLFPGEQMTVFLPPTGMCQIEVRRCRCLQRRCYEIGARFISRFRKENG